MIVIDASALVAIGDEEPDADSFLLALTKDEATVASINYVEAGIILINRQLIATQEDFDLFLGGLGVVVHPSDDLAATALAAYLRYGRGFHPARLNLADCFAYALAKALGAPLLFKGDDFALTDIPSALQPT